MDIRILEPRRVVRHIARVMVDDLEITLDRFYLLEELGECDGFDRRLLIHGVEEAKLLETHELAVRHNKGSYYAGPKLEAWLKAAHQAGILTALNESAQRARGI